MDVLNQQSTRFSMIVSIEVLLVSMVNPSYIPVFRSIVFVFLGTAYGVGVYFSSDAAYSHKYAKANSNGERNMFVARVLIGTTTKGNSSMKTRPVGYDSTTDGNHIFVTYHDAQAYPEYLITYK